MSYFYLPIHNPFSTQWSKRSDWSLCTCCRKLNTRWKWPSFHLDSGIDTHGSECCLFLKIDHFGNINVKKSIANQSYLISWNEENRKYCHCVLDLSPVSWLEITSCVRRSVLSEAQGKTTTENNKQADTVLVSKDCLQNFPMLPCWFSVGGLCVMDNRNDIFYKCHISLEKLNYLCIEVGANYFLHLRW